MAQGADKVQAADLEARNRGRGVTPFDLVLHGLALFVVALALPSPFDVALAVTAGAVGGVGYGVVLGRRESWVVVSLHRGGGQQRRDDTTSQP